MEAEPALHLIGDIRYKVFLTLTPSPPLVTLIPVVPVLG